MDANVFAGEPIRIPSEANLASTVIDQGRRVLMVTAAASGTGITSSAVALAEDLARSSRSRVLLIDASLAETNLTERLGLGSRPGLLDLLLGCKAPPLLNCVDRSGLQGFDFLPLGIRPPSAMRLPPEQIEQLFTELSEAYRFIVIDGDAVYGQSDTLSLASQADGVILVVRAEETRWEVAQAAIQRLEQAGARLVGTVFNARRYYMPKWVYERL